MNRPDVDLYTYLTCEGALHCALFGSPREGAAVVESHISPSGAHANAEVTSRRPASTRSDRDALLPRLPYDRGLTSSPGPSQAPGRIPRSSP